MKRKLKKVQQVREKVSDAVAGKAVALNPLNPPKPEEPPSLANVPRITNENITEHREEVLKGARKYIYPLAHSKRRIVSITFSIIGAAIVGFLIYCGLALYNFYQYNTFLYRVTQVVPFPIARADGHFVDYENYLFQLRRYIHYYQTQQQQNFASNNKQLLQYRQQALSDVVNNAYVKLLASQHGVSVSDKEVDQRVAEVRDQNRLGSNDKVFADVLRDYWGWSINDFRRSLKDQILAEKVVAKLDAADTARAESILKTVQAGADFTATAKQFSNDSSAATNGGDYGVAITKDNPNIPPQVVEELFTMKAGQISSIVNAGTTLEILKLNGVSGNTVTAQHISINLVPISTYINQLKAKAPPHLYVHFKA